MWQSWKQHSQTCVQWSPLGNGKVTVMQGGRYTKGNFAQKVRDNWKFWEVVRWP